MTIRRALAAFLLVGAIGLPALAEGGANLSEDSVYHLELRLSDLGYFTEKCDAAFDEQSQIALERFQQANGLEVTGRVDDATLEAINGDDAVSLEDYLTAFAANRAQATVLKKGDSGSDVKTVQSRLKVLGFFSDKSDGNFGASTQQAVKRFQMANGLDQTGEFDGATRMRLQTEAPITWPAYLAEMACAPGDTGLNVHALQERLSEMGYFDGDCTASYGERTQAAVSRFQTANQMDATGEADAATWGKLFDVNAVPLARADALQLGDTGEGVQSVQARLTELGYLTSEPGGDYDYATQTAARLYQMGNGMEPTGELDEDDVIELLSDAALPADAASVKEAWRTLIDGADLESRMQIAETADGLLGCAFVAAQDALYPGFAFAQYACAAAGVPVDQPETLIALASMRVTDAAEVNAGDVVAFQSANGDGVSIQLAIGAGDGLVYAPVATGGWVALSAIDQMSGANAYRWSPSGGGDE